MINFRPKLPGAKVVLSFGFAGALTPSGATLTGVQSLIVVSTKGLDPSPSAILNGAASVSGSNVLQPVQAGVSGERYLFTVLGTTDNVDLVPEIQAILPVGSSLGPVCYDDACFRQQFPAFADETAYSYGSLQFAWDMGANWLSHCPARWGIGAYRPQQLQQAADLMGAVVTHQLFGPASNGAQTASQDGEAPGAVLSAAEGSVNATFQLPEIGTSAFSSMLLASPPYGRMLLALLQVAASVGPYIRSHRYARVPP